MLTMVTASITGVGSAGQLRQALDDGLDFAAFGVGRPRFVGGRKRGDQGVDPGVDVGLIVTVRGILWFGSRHFA